MQIPEAELQQYTSISQVQTVGLKRLPTLDEYLAKKKARQAQVLAEKSSGVRRVNAIKGSKRKLLAEEQEEIDAKRRNPNVLSLEEDDEDDDDSSSSDEDEAPSVPAAVPTSIPAPVAAPPKVEPKPEKKAKAAPAVTQAPVACTHQTVYVPVHRSAEVQEARLRLPILAEEQEVMETINENPIVIVAGETGSGKTTQLPQFLYEAGYAQHKMIGVTEPRRVAAIAMSKRVAHEMNLPESEVSYLIRFEGNVTPATRIKFMTDGVLLKEIETDFLLSKYSVIILDEAHERSVYTDILVGLLSRIVPLRHKRGQPLKLIIMSATLRVSDFTENERLFKVPPPLLKVEARQFPVTIHFQKRTPDDYVAEAYRKTLKIHNQLPEGGILVFVTGQQEVNQLVRKLRRTFPYHPPKGKEHGKETKEPPSETAAASKEADVEPEDPKELEFDMKRTIRNLRKSKKKFLAQITLPKINLDDYKLPGDDTEADMHEQQDEEEQEELELEDDDADDDANPISGSRRPLWVLPLYSLLSSEKQNRIFQPVPEGCRLCVVSTNVAETSLTIPHIKYVVDSGRQKTRLYDKLTGVSAFVVTYTSKASADQRAGRAGRISAGHCYRLYSSAVYNDCFEAFAQPDIQVKPVEDLMLQMRCMGIDRVVHFPFPSPPDQAQLQAAEHRLTVLGALEARKPSEEQPEKTDLPPAVTRLGHVISRFPVAPRFGKMLALSNQQQLLPYTVCLVAALSVQEVLIETGVQRDEDVAPGANRFHQKRQSWAASGNYQLLGDPMVLLRAVGAAEYAGSQGRLPEFCAANGLRPKAVSEVRKLRVQLTNEINLNVSDVELGVDPELKPPSDAQARFLRQILLAGMGDRVARKVPLADIADKEERRRLKYAYNCADMEEPAFLHASSVLRQKAPEWVVYQEAYELQNGDSTKMFIRGITAIEPEWLLLYVPLLCNIREVRDDPAPRYDEASGRMYCYVDATFGKAGWDLPLGEVEMPLSEKACW